MSKNKTTAIKFTRSKGRRVKADFTGGQISSDGGLLALREVDRRLGLCRAAARGLCDGRQAGKVEHRAEAMLRQRVYALAAGWEDLNDADTLRSDPVHQVAAGSDRELASAATLCRFENSQTRASAVALNRVLVDTFIQAHDQVPEQIILDFDATDAPVHGGQEGRFFHGYYDHHCFLPLYVFCGGHLLVAYLRRSNGDAARHAAAILKLLVEHLRQSWPHTRIVVRADSGFCRDRLLTWCESHQVDYVIGLARNVRLQAQLAPALERARQQAVLVGGPARVYREFAYRTQNSWSRSRRVVGKAECLGDKDNPRFIVTTLETEAAKLYEQVYCVRGEMENRIKEQMMLFADRVSAHRWWANQWRVLLSGLAYTLLEGLRRLALPGTALAKATCATLRLKLIKIGAVIVRTATTVHLHLASHHPCRHIFVSALGALAPPR